MLLFEGVPGPVEDFGSQYNVVDSTANILWSPPPALTIPPADRPEIFYCVQIVIDGSNAESRGCNRTGDKNEDTSIMWQNIMCGVNYDITVIPFNRLGDGPARTLEFPGNLFIRI